MSGSQLKALCLVVLIAASFVGGTVADEKEGNNRKLMQRWMAPTGIAGNMQRASIATSQVRQ